MPRTRHPLRLRRRPDGWHIEGTLPYYDGTATEIDCGPYATRDQAADDRAGLERTARHGHRRDFWTTERKRSHAAA